MEGINLSEKDISQEKENSILNKSFISTDFNFPDLIEKKNYLQIKIETLEFDIQIHSKSISKIFTLISNNDKEELDNNYLNYITCLFEDPKDLDQPQLLAQNSDELNQNLLEPSYYELLRKTKIYYVDISKINSYKNNNKIPLKKVSLEKISLLLNNNIFGMSDYIEIFILSYPDNDSLGERFLLKAKLMGKLSMSLEDIKKENEIFMGVKQFNSNIKVVEKCKKNRLNFDFYFDNVWNAIEKDNIHVENSFNGTPFIKDDEIEEIKIKNNNSHNINYEMPNSYNINVNINKNKKVSRKKEERDESACAACANICNLF